MAEATEREFPPKWTPDCGWDPKEWQEEWARRMAAKSELSMDERLGLEKNENIIEMGKQAASELRRKAAMGIATPVVLAALGIGASAIATGGIALVPALIGAVAGGAIGGASTWRTVVGAFGIRGTDPTVLMYRVQKIMREKQDMEASCNKRLESIKNAMKNLNPESKDYKEQLANLEKQYDNEMRRYDIKRKAIERREVKMHLLANKGKLAIAAHGGSVNPNSIFAKGTIGWINRRRQELGAVGDKLTGGWFNDRNEVKMDAYQDVINATQSLINQSIATREKIGLEKSEVIEAGLDQVNTLESKSIYDAMSQVNKKDYNDDKHFIPRRQTSDYSKKDEDKIHYGEKLSDQILEQKEQQAAYEEYEKQTGVQLKDIIEKLNNDTLIPDDRKLDLKTKLIADKNNMLTYKKNMKIEEKHETFNVFVDLAKNMDSIDGYLQKYKDQGAYALGNLALYYSDEDFKNAFNKYINSKNSGLTKEEILKTQKLGDFLYKLNSKYDLEQKQKEQNSEGSILSEDSEQILSNTFGEKGKEQQKE